MSLLLSFHVHESVGVPKSPVPGGLKEKARGGLTELGLQPDTDLDSLPTSTCGIVLVLSLPSIHSEITSPYWISLWVSVRRGLMHYMIFRTIACEALGKYVAGKGTSLPPPQHSLFRGFYARLSGEGLRVYKANDTFNVW